MKGYRASWLTLAVMVAVTIAAVVLFVAEPVKQESFTEVAAASSPQDEQIAAVDDQGRLVTADPRAAHVSKVFDDRIAIDDVESVTIDRNATGLAAYVGASDGTVSLVHLDTGGVEHVADGLHPALSPDDETLALLRDGHLMLQNTTTGKQQDDGTTNEAALQDVREMTWTPDGSLLLLSTSPTQPVWRFPREAHEFTDAVAVPLPPDVEPSTIEAITGYDGGFALALRDGERTRVVAVTPSGAQTLTVVDGEVAKLDADTEAATALLFVVDQGGSHVLERWTPDQRTIDHVADGILAASW